MPLRLAFSLATFLFERGRFRTEFDPFLAAIGASLHAQGASLIMRGSQSSIKGDLAEEMIRQRSKVQSVLQLARATQPRICGMMPQTPEKCLAPFRLKNAIAPTCQIVCPRRICMRYMSTCRVLARNNLQTPPYEFAFLANSCFCQFGFCWVDFSRSN